MVAVGHHCLTLYDNAVPLYENLMTAFSVVSLASFISRITALCNCVPPLLWLMCRNNPTRGGTDRHEIHATARYRHCSPRPHCRASVSEPGSIRGDHADRQVLPRLALVHLQTALAVDVAV